MHEKCFVPTDRVEIFDIKADLVAQAVNVSFGTGKPDKHKRPCEYVFEAVKLGA